MNSFGGMTTRLQKLFVKITHNMEIILIFIFKISGFNNKLVFKSRILINKNRLILNQFKLLIIKSRNRKGFGIKNILEVDRDNKLKTLSYNKKSNIRN
jgi:hypothetical protein